MIALLQRVSEASCVADGTLSGAIGKGLLLLVCAQREDNEANARALAQKVLKYRVFTDENGKMNLSVQDVQGDILAVSQFTLAADTGSGTRASFTPAAEPVLAEHLYEVFVDELRRSGLQIETGVFGAHMKVSLVNDGPVTFWLQVPKRTGN